jgi:hypothetical protein
MPCDPNRVSLARYKLLNNETGNAELALYYFRCREEPDYLKELKRIKWRARRPDVRHFPERKK